MNVPFTLFIVHSCWIWILGQSHWTSIVTTELLKKMSLGICQHVDPKAQKQLIDTQASWVWVSFLYSHLATDGWGSKPRFKISKSANLWEYGNLCWLFYVSGTSNSADVLSLVDNISLLNENIQNQVDEGCGGGINFVSFLPTVKTGRNERWSHQLQTIFTENEQICVTASQ